MKAAPRRYAAGTNIDPDRSRDELEKLLSKHGATHIGIYKEPTQTRVIFCIGDRWVRQVVRVPAAKPARQTQASRLRKPVPPTTPPDGTDREWRRLCCSWCRRF